MELLAPAGNFLSLKAAIACGANAVYLGMEKYGARAAADNFDSENLSRAVDVCHLHGVKLYLTVNTLIKNSEMRDAVTAALYAYNLGVDAFIVQDLGLVSELQKAAPDIVLHASTQMGICNAYGAEFARKLGVSRVVVARETLLDDIREIKSKTGMEIEAFCHGALCVSYSGNCYYSSLVSGCSGNRGRCLQLCRKKYTVGNDSGYFLSAKDICLADKIALLKNVGVDSIKIEGRMRTPEYVAETVSVYRSAIDGKRIGIEDIDRLKRVFNRGDYCKAYLMDSTENIIYDKVQNNIGVKAGTVKSVKCGKAVIDAVKPLKTGDGVKYLRKGYEVGGGLIDGDNATGFQGDVKAGDEVRLTSVNSLKTNIASLDIRCPVNISVNLFIGAKAQMTADYGNNSVYVDGKETVKNAIGRAITEDDVKRTIGSLGGTDFALKELCINMDNNVFYPLSLIKDMRKKVISELSAEILRDRFPVRKTKSKNVVNDIDWFVPENSAIFVQVDSICKLSKVEFDYDYVVLNPMDYGDYNAIKSACDERNGNIIINLPFIVRGDDKAVLQKLKTLNFSAVVANNISQLEMFCDYPVIGGIGLNSINSYYSGVFIDSIEKDTSPEGIAYVYGKPPLMHFAHCPRKNRYGSCKDCNGYGIEMKDDKGICVRINRIKEKFCYGVLVPETPINNIDRIGTNNIFIDLTYSDENEIMELNKQINCGSAYGLECTHGNMARKLQ